MNPTSALMTLGRIFCVKISEIMSDIYLCCEYNSRKEESPLEDALLLALVRENPEKGWRQMMDQYTGLLFHIIRGKMGARFSQEEIEDCVSEVLAQAFEQWERYDPEKSSIKTYLSMIAVRRAIDAVRKYRETGSIDDENAQEVPELSLGLLEETIQRENRSELLQAVKRLPEIDQRLLRLRFWEDQSSKQIALAVGLTPAAVDQRIHRVLLKLRNTMGGERYEAYEI